MKEMMTSCFPGGGKGRKICVTEVYLTEPKRQVPSQDILCTKGLTFTHPGHLYRPYRQC